MVFVRLPAAGGLLMSVKIWPCCCWQETSLSIRLLREFNINHKLTDGFFKLCLLKAKLKIRKGAIEFLWEFTIGSFCVLSLFFFFSCWGYLLLFCFIEKDHRDIILLYPTTFWDLIIKQLPLTLVKSVCSSGWHIKDGQKRGFSPVLTEEAPWWIIYRLGSGGWRGLVM